ncbi:hypothetical protein DMN91_013051 [Ooceraea biroi]|uniref:Reverse transcriptase domain-containing protein n=1 Tax=Ooceraea biroi TaxID=2015173 RepID=A0A3L8D2G3_OOCBI|nr:hypothetical protein DMN91_013051 [Ooceraea biroi]
MEESILRQTWSKKGELRNVEEGSIITETILTRVNDESMKRAVRSQRRSVYWWNPAVDLQKTKCIKARRKFLRIKRKKERVGVEVYEEAVKGYREERCKLRKEIEMAKRKAWDELLDTLDKDPWGKPYLVVLNKLRGGKNALPQGSILGPRLWDLVYEAVTNMKLIEDTLLTCYADDTFFVVAGRTLEEAKFKMNLAVNGVVRKVRQLGLEIAAHKTEAIVFPPCTYKRWNKKVYIKVDNVNIECNNVGVKYLGVTIDPFWSYNAHFNIVVNKANMVACKLINLMRNLKGPNDRKRRLYANTIYAILLYGAPIWAEEFEADKRAKVTIRKLQRKLALRVISAYRTVSYEAAEILACLPPIDLTANKMKAVYNRKQAIIAEGNVVTERAVNAIKRQEEQNLVRKWKERLQEGSLPGQRVREAILPCFEQWLERKHGNMNFYMTQLMTGHGSFGAFRQKIGKSRTAKCNHCLSPADTAQHTVEICAAWMRERRELRSIIEGRITLDNLIVEMLKTEEKWKAVNTFATEVLRKKEEEERRREREQHEGR